MACTRSDLCLETYLRPLGRGQSRVATFGVGYLPTVKSEYVKACFVEGHV